MNKEELHYEAISEKVREELEKWLWKNIMENARTEEHDEEYYIYEVMLQKIHFRCAMSDDEMRRAIKCSIDILEELKDIRNKGFDREKLIAAEKKAKERYEGKEDFDPIIPLCIYAEFETERLDEIKSELADIMGVGGAYYMLISNPSITNGIYVVFEQIIDRFNEFEWYASGAYFLLRCIMHMRCQEL